jgi:hypothetical protein
MPFPLGYYSFVVLNKRVIVYLQCGWVVSVGGDDIIAESKVSQHIELDTRTYICYVKFNQRYGR